MAQEPSGVKRAQQSEVRPHQLGQDVFKTILPDDVDWKPYPSFPPGVLLAVVVGQPSEPGPYTIRVKAPHGAKLMPHKHPEDRVYTVISGVFYIGLGDEFDASKLEAYPPGAVIVLPRQHAPFPLGEIRRVCHANNGDRAAWTGIPQPERRSAKQQLVGRVRTAFCRPKRTGLLILSLDTTVKLPRNSSF
jgi:quercetin dioxygenase-like cupin family protein